VKKGMGCSSCHGRVDQMPLMYMQNTLQMEWCLDCHRNPAKNIRPTTQIYNMAWEAPSEERPVWCSVNDERMGLPTAQSVNCVSKDPSNVSAEIASLQAPSTGAKGVAGDAPGAAMPVPANYKKFTDQSDMGHFLVEHYKIRTPRELTSCEVCHR
jgi:hypothetical protein